MKQIISVLLCITLCIGIAACGGQQPVPTTVSTTETATLSTTEPTTVPTTEPQPTEPESIPGRIRAGYGEMIFCTLEKGTEVTVMGEFLDYYVIRGGEANLLMDKRFVRLETDEPFSEFTGYAKWNAPLYDDPYFESEPIQNLKSNFKVTVKDGKDNWLYIEWEDGSGYISEDQIRTRPASSGGGGYNSGGGGGGSADGSDVPMGSLAFNGTRFGISLLSTYSGPEFTEIEDTVATILIPYARAYLVLLNKDDIVKVVTVGDAECSIYYDGYYVSAPRWLIQLEEDPAYESWDGYAKYNAVFFEEYQMRNQIQQLRTNTGITVLDELPTCYIVEVEGQLGYMRLDGVSEKRISTGGGNNNGGGGNGSSGGSEWTPPAL